MKEGDKVYCIRNRECYDYGHKFKYGSILNKKGEIYIITDISDIAIITTAENNLHCGFSPMIVHQNSRNHILFCKHFITWKEYRKQKLEKINEN